jgi:NADPH:quinone reductase-like Zn-dependent oxidoreductase
MKAIILETPGGIENLKLTEVSNPIAGNEEVVVQVKAISINPVDVKTRAGKGMYGRLKEENPLIIGWDISGIVTEVGTGVTVFKPGDEVFGMVNFPSHGKAYAAYNAAPASHLAKKPANVSFEEAAAATLAALTAWQALVKHANLQKGQKILIHAASGGVGHFAVQIAKYLGAYVIGTSSVANKDFVLSLGADEHVDYQAVQFEDVVKNMDFVLETVGGQNIERSLDSLKKGGSVISILGNGPETAAEKAKLKEVQIKSFLVQASGDDMKAIAELLQKEVIKPHVSQTFPFEKMGEAHLLVETGRVRGKVIVLA